MKRISDPDYLWDVPAFEHAAMHPPRADLIGDVVFAEEWPKFLKKLDDGQSPVNEPLHSVLHNLGYELCQRAATVAASIICWLGTNNGRGFLHEAEMLSLKMLNGSDAYLAAWAVENARTSHSNHGIRRLEFLLRPPEAGADLQDLSAYDLEVADHLVRWLGSEEGQKFLQHCRKEIERRGPEHEMYFHLRHNLGLPDDEVKKVMQMSRDAKKPGYAPA